MPVTYLPSLLVLPRWLQVYSSYLQYNRTQRLFLLTKPKVEKLVNSQLFLFCFGFFVQIKIPSFILPTYRPHGQLPDLPTNKLLPFRPTYRSRNCCSTDQCHPISVLFVFIDIVLDFNCARQSPKWSCNAIYVPHVHKAIQTADESVIAMATATDRRQQPTSDNWDQTLTFLTVNAYQRQLYRQ